MTIPRFARLLTLTFVLGALASGCRDRIDFDDAGSDGGDDTSGDGGGAADGGAADTGSVDGGAIDGGAPDVPSDTGVPDVCGDGTLGDTEACDDGNTITETECDYGTATCTGCSNACELLTLTGAVCGDGALDTEEACDDGNAISETECEYGTATCTGCSNACALLTLTGSTCGDGALHPLEECDHAGDGCVACEADTLIAISRGGNGASYGPVLSDDGISVAFYTRSTNFDPVDTTSSYDVYLRRIDTGTLTLVSRSADGLSGSNGDSTLGGISGDGDLVVFHSQATNLDAGDTDASNDVYLYRRSTGTRRLVTALATGSSFADQERISGDGRFVVLRTDAAALTGGAGRQIVLYDVALDTFETLSVDGASALGNAASNLPSIATDGSVVAFDSLATNLVSGDTTGLRDVFVRDRLAGTTTRVSVASDGTPGNGASRNPVISGNGRWVAFVSAASNLVSGDTTGIEDVFVHDRMSGATVRVSLAEGGGQGTDASRIAAGGVSNTGVVVFSHSSALLAIDTDGIADVYAYDLGTGALRLVSTTAAGAVTAAFDEAPSITSDGSVITFQSNAGALITGVSGSHVYRREW
jgi:Tol biopolymer transport system component